MKIAIVGSRSFNDYDLFVGELNKIFSEEDFEIDEIVSGEALGTDLMAKKLALNKFISLCSDYSSKMLHNFSFGFSDDDKKTINLIKDFFKEKSLEIPNTKLSVFDTSDRKIKGGVKSTFTYTN